MNTYTCPRGGKLLQAATLDELARKVSLHEYLYHRNGGAFVCEARLPQPVAPLGRAYRHESAKGVTS